MIDITLCSRAARGETNEATCRQGACKLCFRNPNNYKKEQISSYQSWFEPKILYGVCQDVLFICESAENYESKRESTSS